MRTKGGPFDWKTPFGYLVAWFGEYAGFVAVLMTATPCFNVILGSSWLFIVVAYDITNDVAAFNRSVKILKHGINIESFIFIPPDSVSKDSNRFFIFLGTLSNVLSHSCV